MTASAAPTQAITVRAGVIVVQRIVDIAFAIDLVRVEALFAAQAATSRARLSTTPAKAMTFGDPPVVLPLPPTLLSFDGETIECGVTANVYHFGALAMAIRVPVGERAWEQLVDLQRRVDAAIGSASEASVWTQLCRQIVDAIGPALERPSATPLREDYTLVIVQDLGLRVSAEELLQRIDIVPLLSGEDRPLAESYRTELLRQRFSYYADDLAVLTWDRAFIYEPRGDSDVIDVLEVANAQLLELRYYDELLDAELPQMYDEVERARHAAGLLAARHFAHLARRLHTLVAEVTELTEKVDNALQVTEDVYLARVYSAALGLFRVPNVAAAVDRKLAIVRDTYTALYEEASSRRAELLEIAIVLLIVIEIVLALRG